jgi:transcriptional regulator with XRE-family HTH domain
MRLHGNAKTCPHSRRLLVERLERGWTLAEAAQAAGVSARTAAKWRARWRSEGDAGLLDRSSAPKRIPHRTPADRVRVIELLRRLRMTAAEIAEVLGMALSTVSAILKRIGLGKRSRLEPLEPPNRYECSRPGELLHIDVKKLARFTRPGHRMLGRGRGRFETAAGYEYLHVCVDDYAGLPTPSSSRTSGRTRRSRSYAGHSPSSRRVASPASASSPTTAPPTSRVRTATPVLASGFATHAHDRDARARTARRSDSSRRCSPNGPTRASMEPATSGPARFRSGSITTTTGDHTEASATDRRARG